MTLEYIYNLLEQLGNPQDHLKVIQVAGTNGKGSTSRMLQTVLAEAGYKVGLFSSPALISFNEGIDLNGIWISEEDFSTSLSKIIESCKQLISQGKTHPTIYECLVVGAIDYFISKAVDLVIFEVGLGGRLDGTNVFKNPLMSIITSIGYDHMAFLGHTLGEIAKEKAGIIKAQRPVLIGPMVYQAYSVIENIAKKLQAPIISMNHATLMYSTNIVPNPFPEENEQPKTNSTLAPFHPLLQHINLDIAFDIGTPIIDTQIGGTYESSLIGEHQITNLSLVITAINILLKEGYYINQTAIENGLSKVVWPCRQEYFTIKRGASYKNMLFDGAHNIDSINALVETIKNTFPNRKIITIFSALDDKKITDMLSTLSQITSHVVCTTIDNKRGVDGLDIANIAKQLYKKVDIYSTPTEALEYAFTKTDYDMILVTGSLYLTVPLRFNLLNYEIE